MKERISAWKLYLGPVSPRVYPLVHTSLLGFTAMSHWSGLRPLASATLLTLGHHHDSSFKYCCCLSGDPAVWGL